LTAEQIVTNKVKQFARNRLTLVRSIGRHFNKKVPPEVERFFEAMQGEDWDEIKRQFREIAKRAGRYDYSTSHDPELDPFWRAVQETFGAAEQAHLWPAQKLLDYGNAVLDSLRPGMSYVGGTDAGCFIPTMMNETSGGDRHVVLTQNALADADYCEYLQFLYGDQLALPDRVATQRAFQDYAADALKRSQHDQQFPDESKQLRPGENVALDASGNPQVSGATAVMSINERLLQSILQKNPGISFAMEESFSLPSTYVGAAPLGPIFEMRAQNAQNAMTSDAAAQSLDYWRATTQQLLVDPEAANSTTTLNAWSHDLAAQGNLLVANQLPAEAEQAYLLATQLSPANPGAASAYADFLISQNRLTDAAQVAANALRSAPDNQQLKDLVQRMSSLQTTPLAR
jgi:hypothetical protein